MKLYEPIFILGAPRSGTTFLASLLERTPYGPPFETHFITKYFKKLSNYGDLSDRVNFSKLVADILSERAVMQWKLDLDMDVMFGECANDLSFSAVTNYICTAAASRKGFLQWGDKTPHYLGDFEIISSLFPNSKFLYIVRDGRDVALSLFEKDWGPNNTYYAAEYWKKLNRQSEAIDALKESGQLYFLRYEDLLDDVERYIVEIYEFLGVECQAEDVIELSRHVKKGNYGKWVKQMNALQKRVFERVAGSTLEKFGYETSHKEGGLSALLRSGYFIHNAVFRLRHLFIVNVIDTIKIKFFGKEPFAE